MAGRQADDSTDNVTKRELADRVHKALVVRNARVSRQVVREVLQVSLAEIVAALAAGERIELRDFGVFETRTRAPRRGRNPRTMKTVDVPARRCVKFKPGRLMRDEVEIDVDPSTGEAIIAEPAAPPTVRVRAAVARRATARSADDRPAIEGEDVGSPEVHVAEGLRHASTAERASRSGPVSEDGVEAGRAGYDDSAVPIRSRKAATPSR